METGELKEVLTRIKDDVGEIKEQVKITNGRVSALENWRWFITGGFAALTALVLPILFKSL